MSSSNLVKLVYIEETVIGETPVAGNFDTIRYISESLSGTPETTESQQIRTDRLTNGQVVTGLTVQGDVGFELAKETPIDSFIESAMQSSFAAQVDMNTDFTIDDTAKTITRLAGDFTTDLADGDLIKFSGFASSVINAAQAIVSDVVSATVIKYVGSLADEGPTTATVSLCDKIGIGVTKKSFSMEKIFEDLTDKAINYKGMMVNTLSLNVAYGSIISGSFGFVGTDNTAVALAADFITDGRTVNAAATTQSLNGSIDMPLIASDVAGGLIDGLTFCIQSVEISLDNNSRPENCIGEAAPQDHNFGSASISVSISAYLSNENWNMLAKKLTQESFSLAFQVKNSDGYYSFFMPAVQVSFDDPSSEGPNQDVILSMSGTAKVGSAGEKSLYIFKS